MKFQSKFILISSAAALSFSSLALADEPAVAHCEVSPPALEAPTPIIIINPGVEEPKATDVKVEETVVTDVAVVEKADQGEPTVCEKTPAEVTATGGEETINPTNEAVPLDWVKRGGEDNPVIYYNMAGGGSPVASGGASSAITRGLGLEGKASAIETKSNAVSPLIKSEKKETEAVIKNNRVFLR